MQKAYHVCKGGRFFRPGLVDEQSRDRWWAFHRVSEDSDLLVVVESGESPDISEELGTHDPSLGLSVLGVVGGESSLLDAGVVGDIIRMLNGCWAIVKEG